MSDEAPGIVHWIDHYVICTNDVQRWAAFHSHVLGARTVPDPTGRLKEVGVFQDVGRSRFGGFIARFPLPATRGLGKGIPRYGYYIYEADLDAHIRRLDAIGAVHSEPIRTSAEGDTGATIYWQDPDGNQFEFWAPDELPAGAMSGCGPERVGRISHGVFESRDLDRTASFFARYCGIHPIRDRRLAEDTLVLRLAAGARLIFRKVDELQGRTTGCGLPDTHTALTVRTEEFFPNYRRLWAELREWDFDPLGQQPLENGGALPARTVLHPSPAGRRFKDLTQRGDDFFDWDTNLFHFYGGTPLGDSMAVYEGQSTEYYIQQWEETHGTVATLKSVVHS